VVVRRAAGTALGLWGPGSALAVADRGCATTGPRRGDIVAAARTIRRTQQDWERETAGEIWQQTKDIPSLVFTGRYGTPVDPRTLNRKFTVRGRGSAPDHRS
jgi:hypothetical protein